MKSLVDAKSLAPRIGSHRSRFRDVSDVCVLDADSVVWLAAP